MLKLIFQATMIWQAIISGIGFLISARSAWSEFKWMCFYLAPSKINQQCKQTNGIICSSFCLRFSRLRNPIIQTKLEQAHCCSYVYLKVKWNVFWQRLSYIVLQQLPANQAKSFQITLEILKKWYDIMGESYRSVNFSFKSMYFHTLLWTQNALECLSL